MTPIVQERKAAKISHLSALRLPQSLARTTSRLRGLVSGAASHVPRSRSDEIETAAQADGPLDEHAVESPRAAQPAGEERAGLVGRARVSLVPGLPGDHHGQDRRDRQQSDHEQAADPGADPSERADALDEQFLPEHWPSLVNGGHPAPTSSLTRMRSSLPSPRGKPA